MGQYNFYAPTILGQEWVPIREEDQTFSPVVNAVEVGHEFTLATARSVQEGRFYLNDFPAGQANGQVFEMAVYAAGTEGLSGPVQRVVIPCNSGLISGSTSFGSASGVADALADPSDLKQLETFAGSFSGDGFQTFYPLNSYAQQLNGKRILAVNVLYTLSGQVQQAIDAGLTITMTLSAGNGAIAKTLAIAILWRPSGLRLKEPRGISV